MHHCLLVAYSCSFTFTNVFLQVRGNHVAPIYVINLLISDLIQFFCMIAEMATQMRPDIKVFFHVLSGWASVGFMVCIALER